MKTTVSFLLKTTNFLILAVFLWSCSNTSEPTPKTTGSVLVVNEGAFFNDNSSVSLFDTKTKSVSLDIFKKKNNGVSFGGTVQSVGLSADQKTAYICVATPSGNDKLMLAQSSDFQAIKEIMGMEIPRYGVALGNRIFVSNWGKYVLPAYTNPNSFVAVINGITNEIEKKIAVSSRPEGLLVFENKIYVACGTGNNITVIDANSLTILKTIKTEGEPQKLVLDKNNKIWVLCQTGFLQQIEADQVVKSIKIEKLQINSQLATNPQKDLLYLVSGEPYPSQESALWAWDISASTWNAKKIVDKRNIYGLGVDSNDGTIYVGIAPDFQSNGTVLRLKTDGTEIDNFGVGIAPNGFIFR